MSMAADMETMRDWQGLTVVDRDGDKAGTLVGIYLDEATGQPEWGLVRTGLLGRRRSFVPLTQAVREGDTIRVPHDKSQIKDAPSVEPDGELSQDEEIQLYRHYGLDYWDGYDGGRTTAAAGGDTAAPDGDAGTEPVVAVVRLRRWIVVADPTE